MTSHLIPRFEAPQKMRDLQSLITKQQRLVGSGVSATLDLNKFVQARTNGKQIRVLIEQSELQLNKSVDPLAFSDLSSLNSQISQTIEKAKRLHMAESVSDPGLEDAKKLSLRLTSGDAQILTEEQVQKSLLEYRTARDVMRNRQPPLPRPLTP